jgi:hypothetical protein
MWGKCDQVCGGEGRSLVDVVGMGDRVLWLMKGRSLFGLGE